MKLLFFIFLSAYAFALTVNEQSVQTNLNALSAAGQMSADLNSIYIMPPTADNLDAMHPAAFSALVEVQSELDGQLLNIFHRLPYLACSCNYPGRLWVEPFGNTLTLKNHGMQVGAQCNTGGVAFGLDGRIGDQFVLGIGGAYNYSYLHWHKSRGHSKFRGLYGGIYADYTIGAFYLGATALAGRDSYFISRHIAIGANDRHARSYPMALDIMAQVTAAYLFGAPQAYFYPYATLDYLYLHTHSVAERSAQGLDLTVNKHTDSTLRTEIGLGLIVQDTNRDETMCVSPKVTIGWVRMSPVERPAYVATFESATIPFRVHGWNRSWDLLHALLGLGITYYNATWKAEYNADVACDRNRLFFNQRLNLGVDWKW